MASRRWRCQRRPTEGRVTAHDLNSFHIPRFQARLLPRQPRRPGAAGPAQPRDRRLRGSARRGLGGRAGGRRLDRGGAGRPALPPEADRQRELRLPGGAAGDGQLAQRQVRGGRSRAPLLRGLRERRRHREPCRRAGQGALRQRPRLHPAAQRDRRQPGGLLVDPDRPDRGPGAGAARPQGPALPLQEEWAGLRREFGNQRMLGMALDAGGHLTHGFRPNISGKLFDLSHYSVDPQTNRIDYDQVRERALQVRPLVLLAGYSSYPRQINFRVFREIADEVGATFMVDMAHFAGLVAGKVFTGDFDPVRHAHIVTTTTHKTLRGPRGGMVLCEERLGPVVDRGCPLVLGGPLPHVMAAKAVALTEASRPEFAAYSRQVVDNAATLADALQSEGATVVTGGTDNHLLLLDVRRSASPAGRPNRPCAKRGSPSTAT